jgi:hypothetical protein
VSSPVSLFSSSTFFRIASLSSAPMAVGANAPQRIASASVAGRNRNRVIYELSFSFQFEFPVIICASYPFPAKNAKRGFRLLRDRPNPDSPNNRKITHHFPIGEIPVPEADSSKFFDHDDCAGYHRLKRLFPGHVMSGLCATL